MSMGVTLSGGVLLWMNNRLKCLMVMNVSFMLRESYTVVKDSCFFFEIFKCDFDLI